MSVSDDSALSRSACLLLSAILAMYAPLLAKKKPSSEPLVDRIDVVGHVALEGTVVTNMRVIDYHDKRYLYLEDRSGRITVVDVTDAAHPTIRKQQLQPPGAAVSGRLESAVGNVALLVAPQQREEGSRPGTVSIVDFSDSARPKLIRRFENVTAMRSDTRRGLVFISNHEGLWLLMERPAPDLQAERAYEQYLRYNH
jgi:hypothetical protein